MRLDDARVRFEVHDTGPGIDADAQQRLFRPFTQADESTTRRFGGTGLGLSICRELATLMGGEVGVQSRLGEGSCFWAELPLPAATVSAPGPQPQADDAAALSGARVLMVEDNPVNMLIAVDDARAVGRAASSRPATASRRSPRCSAAPPPGSAIRRRADGRADAGDERPRGHARAAPRCMPPRFCRSSR